MKVIYKPESTSALYSKQLGGKTVSSVFFRFQTKTVTRGYKPLCWEAATQPFTAIYRTVVWEIPLIT